MNLETFLEERRMRNEQAPVYRKRCLQCRQPDFSCYCADLKPFECPIHFVILIHPIEVRRRIATGRMAHLCLNGSRLIQGQNFSQHSEVNALIEEPGFESFVLYPGIKSLNLSELDEDSLRSSFQANKQLRLFVIDGTWNTARSMMNQSLNLKSLPRLCFTPDRPSNFRVRKQPSNNCYSTIEAIHHVLNLVGNTKGFDVESRTHDTLLNVFDSMVDAQVKHIHTSPRRYRTRKNV